MTAPSSAHAAPPVEAPRPHSLGARGAGIVLLLFLAAGLVSTLAAVATERLDLLPHPLGRAAFLDGASMRDMAAALADAPMARAAASTERQASWLATGDLGPQVRQGCPGWLFLATEITPQPDADRHLRERAQAVVAIHEDLRQRGIRLLVALVPDKSRIENARLCGLERSAAIDNRLRVWAGRLGAGGVPMVDTSAALRGLLERGEDPFLRTDSHWTQDGAAAAAAAVAAAVRRQGIELAPHQDYAIDRSRAPARRPGDLVRLAGIDGLPLELQPAPETTGEHVFTKRAGSSAGGATGATPASAEDELFGDTALPQVALLGTSFSRTSHFADYLAADLQTPVASFAKDGGDFWGSAGAYFASDAFRQTAPKLVIWEIPERTLQLPTTGERWQIP